jgi:alpha-galactosidase
MKKVIVSMAMAISGLFAISVAQGVATVTEDSVRELLLEDDRFTDIKFEELNEKVQATVNALGETYTVDSLKYNAEKQVTKVKATSKVDQSSKVFYFNNEGVEIVWEKPVLNIEVEEEKELQELP